MKHWLRKFDNWCLKRNLWKAADQLLYCGQKNINQVQININNAKDSIYAAIRELDNDRTRN